MEVDPCGSFGDLGKGPVVGKIFHDDREKLHSDLIDLDLCTRQMKSDLGGGDEIKSAGCFDEAKAHEFPTSSERSLTLKEENTVTLSTIFYAIEEGNPEALNRLLDMSNVDLNQTNNHGEGAVHVAAGLGQLEILKALASKGINLGVTDYRGDSAVYWAARQGHEEVIQFLVSQGVLINQQNKDGETPLHIASSRGHLDCVRYLIKARAEVDIPNDSAVGGNTPLHLSIIRHYTAVAMLLLHSGADFDLPNIHGDTPIHIAAREGLLGLSQSLCAFGCAVDVSNKVGLYPLHLAAKNGHKELVRCLALAGCRIDVKTKDGVTPELLALAQGHADINELLKRLKRDGCDDYIEQLIPMPTPIPKIKMKVFGHSGVGKTTLIESMRAGIFSGLFRRSKRKSTGKKNSIQDPTTPPAATFNQRKLVTSNSIVHDSFTKGIDITQCNLGTAGDLSIWEFSGQESYFIVYDHYIGNTNCIHTVVYNLEEPPNIQYEQIKFWLGFLQSRIPPVEPLGPYGRSHKPARILLVGTHPDTTNCRKNIVGEFISPDTDLILGKILNEFGNVFNIHAHAFLIDANMASSPSMKAFKTVLSDFKTEIVNGREAKSLNVLAENELIGLDCTTGDLAYTLVTQREPDHQGLPRLTRFLENIVAYLPDWRKTLTNFQAVPWHYFVDHVRMNINPLAADDHMKEIIQQLQLMGEVVYLKGEKCSDMIVLDPRWICTNVCGHFLSPQFISQAKSTGCYSMDELQGVTTEYEAEDLIPIFESLILCAMHESEGETVYEFPTYIRDNFEGVFWNKEDTKFRGGKFGGVLLKASSSNKLLSVMFPRLQTQMRRCLCKKHSSECHLIQMCNLSKYCLPNLESLVVLDAECEDGYDTIQVKIRGAPGHEKECFLFLEEILGIIDHVLLEMSPGMGVDKCMMSPHDLENYSPKVYTWNPIEIVKNLFKTGFDSVVFNPQSNVDEQMVDLICFGSREISSALRIGKDLHISTVATLTRQQLCQLLDPPDPLGKDWCMLAVKLEMSDKLPKLVETKKSSSYTSCSNASPTAKLLDEWEHKSSSTVGELMLKLEELGREDTVQALLAGCSLYRILTVEESSEYPTQESDKDDMDN